MFHDVHITVSIHLLILSKLKIKEVSLFIINSC